MAKPKVRDRVRDDLSRVRAALYGQAIGDSLGLRDEFTSAEGIAKRRPDGGPFTFDAVNRADGTSWVPGEWSDDTDRALCGLDAILEFPDKPKVLPLSVSFAKRLSAWLASDGRGSGGHTRLVMGHPLFHINPQVAARDVWEQSGRNAAPNGAVMGTVAAGIAFPHDLDVTEFLAKALCQVTHADPRCVASSVAASIAIASLVQGAPIGGALEEARVHALAYDKDVVKYLKAELSLKDLKLDEGLPRVVGGKVPPIGFTYKTLGAGVFALQELDRRLGSWVGSDRNSMLEAAEAFREILTLVIRAGGDTDTNAAVAGALMGASLGMAYLPTDLVQGMPNRKLLDERLDRLVARL